MQMLHSRVARLSIVQIQSKRIINTSKTQRQPIPQRVKKAFTADSSFAKPAAFSGIFAALNKLTETIQRRQVYRTSVNELSALSDRDLSDLGLSRASIRRLAQIAANAL